MEDESASFCMTIALLCAPATWTRRPSSNQRTEIRWRPRGFWPSTVPTRYTCLSMRSSNVGLIGASCAVTLAQTITDTTYFTASDAVAGLELLQRLTDASHGWHECGKGDCMKKKPLDLGQPRRHLHCLRRPVHRAADACHRFEHQRFTVWCAPLVGDVSGCLGA